MSYRLMFIAYAVALALTAYNVGRDVVGPGVWKS